MSDITIIRTPELIGAEIRTLTTQARCITLWYGIEIGRRLTEAKELLKHGEWIPFLEKQTEFSTSTASRFMQLFREYGSEQSSLFGAEAKFPTLGNLSITNALRLLAIPENEREDFAAENDLEHKSAREVDELIKAKQAAESEKAELERKLKQAQRDLQEMDEGQALTLAQKDSAIFEAGERIDELTGQLRETRAALKELESRPQPVAIERDEKAIQEAAEKAKAEAMAEADKELKKIKAEQSKQSKDYEQRIKAQIDEAQKMQDELAALKAAQSQSEGSAQRIAALEKQIAMAKPEVYQFQAAFERVQKEIDSMIKCLSTVDQETHSKLHRAAVALANSLMQQLQAGEQTQA